MMGCVEVLGMGSLEFAEAARQMGEVLRDQGQVVPTFRSPPRRAGLTRSIKRRADGSVTVAVALRGRTMAAIAADMIDGVIVSNDLQGSPASGLRDQLWSCIDGLLDKPVLQPGVVSASRSRAHLSVVQAA